MKKPRVLERKLLVLYLDVYDEWVQSPFLRLRTRQVLNDKSMNPSRSELSRYITSIWDVLNSCIEGYALFSWATREVKRQYFAPTMGHLCESPEIWRKCWEEHVEAERKQPTVERDPSRHATL